MVSVYVCVCVLPPRLEKGGKKKKRDFFILFFYSFTFIILGKGMGIFFFFKYVPSSPPVFLETLATTSFRKMLIAAHYFLSR